MRRTTLFALAVALSWICLSAAGQAVEPLPATQPLVMQGDLAEQMVAGIDRFLLRETAESAARRRGIGSPIARTRQRTKPR